MANFIVGVLQETPEYGQVIRPIHQGESSTAKATAWAKKNLDAEKFADANRIVIMNATASFQFRARPVLTEDESPTLGGTTHTESKTTNKVEAKEPAATGMPPVPQAPGAVTLPPSPEAAPLPPPPQPHPKKAAPALDEAALPPSPPSESKAPPAPPPLPVDAAPVAPKAPPAPPPTPAAAPAPTSTPPAATEAGEEAVDLEDIF